MKISARAKKEFQKAGRKGGLIGWKNVLRTMTAEERKARASKAGKAGAKARWGRGRGEKS